MKPDKLFSHWRWIRKGLIDVIEKFQDSDLSYSPYPEGWVVGQIMVHIANAEEGWFRYVVTNEIEEWPTHLQFENYPARSEILKVLESVHSATEEYLETLSEEDLTKEIHTPWGESIPLGWIIWHVIEHEIHHRGELSLILGFLGKEGLDV
jgi:uncharacterized damage-inducible protein DinB